MHGNTNRGPAAAALPHRMKFLPGRMHWNAWGAFTGSLESLLPLRMKILLVELP